MRTLRKKIIGIVCLLCTLHCGAQESAVRNSLKTVNTILEQYTIGTDEFRPYDIREHGDRFMFKKFELSVEYPNFVLSYTVGGRIRYSGWVSSIKEGTYKLVFPISSDIEYPVEELFCDRMIINGSEIKIINNDGLEKTTNGKKSIVTSFSFYGDGEFTTKKLAEALISLRDNVMSSNFRGRLSSHETGRHTNNGNSSKASSQRKSSKSGTYGQ